MKKTLLIVFALSLLLAADEKKPDDVQEKLKGVWTVVSTEVGGKKLPDDMVKGQMLTFEGDKAIFDDGKGKKETAIYKIDASKKPAQMDLTPTEGPEKDKTMKLIFELDGDLLKIVGKMKPDERPAGFDDKDRNVITLKRAKK